jgi:hypothetical protein
VEGADDFESVGRRKPKWKASAAKVAAGAATVLGSQPLSHGKG